MRLPVFLSLIASACVAHAASWGFEDASISVQEVRGSEVDSKATLSPDKPLLDPLTLTAAGSLRLGLTVTNGGKPRRPHQAFVTITRPESGLEESFPMTLNNNGKAKFDIVQSKIPSALLGSKSPLRVSIVIGSFGTSKPLQSTLFTFFASADGTPAQPSSLRYGAQPEITHTFNGDPRSPPKIITLAFTFAVLACLPALFIAWIGIGANLKHLPKALGAAPISHLLFFGSILGMEWVFYMYYTSWKLFTVLPVAGVVGLVGFLSGSGALTEVQERRLKGER